MGVPHAPCRLQAFALVILEHWEADPHRDFKRDPRFVGEYGSFDPDYRNWTQREYGLRIGVFRVLDVLARAGIRPAVALNARLLERSPDWIERLADLPVEWVAHGMAANHMMHAAMSRDQQGDYIGRCTEAMTQRIGRAPAGWLSQDWGTSPDTYELLAQAGYRYTLDWCNDDAPYALSTTRPLVALPLSAEWDDVQCQWLRNLEPRAHAALTEAAFMRLRRECLDGRGAACFGLPIHPWVSGMSSRIGALRTLIDRLAATDDVDWKLPHEIVEAPPMPRMSAHS
jgi:peptidoglycan/xylan/chitin deacetylase (PgdA/CDA1 family)